MRLWVTYDNDLAFLKDGVVRNDFLLRLLGINHGLVGVLGVNGFRHCGFGMYMRVVIQVATICVEGEWEVSGPGLLRSMSFAQS